MLGTLVVLYLFLGGCGAGVMFVTAAWSLAFHRTRTRTQEQTAAFGDLKARCYGIGFVMLCLAALCLLLSSLFGIPVSTTHTKTSAIMGVGAVKRLSAINFGVVKDMMLTWVFTFPGCGLISFVMAKIFTAIF